MERTPIRGKTIQRGSGSRREARDVRGVGGDEEDNNILFIYLLFSETSLGSLLYSKHVRGVTHQLQPSSSTLVLMCLLKPPQNPLLFIKLLRLVSCVSLPFFSSLFFLFLLLSILTNITGDVDTLEEIFQHGFPVDVQDTEGVTPFMLSCHKGKFETMRILAHRSNLLLHLLYFIYFCSCILFTYVIL